MIFCLLNYNIFYLLFIFYRVASIIKTIICQHWKPQYFQEWSRMVTIVLEMLTDMKHCFLILMNISATVAAGITQKWRTHHLIYKILFRIYEHNKYWNIHIFCCLFIGFVCQKVGSGLEWQFLINNLAPIPYTNQEWNETITALRRVPQPKE